MVEHQLRKPTMYLAIQKRPFEKRGQ